MDSVNMPIAVIGMGFRGPGDATDPTKFFRMMCEKRDAWGPVPSSKWNQTAFYHPNRARIATHNVQGGHWMAEDFTRFDAPFFNMTKSEADALDPQQRLLLECCYEALENAGIPLERAVGSDTAVFTSASGSDFSDMQIRDAQRIPTYYMVASGCSTAMDSNRLSYFFDFHGPSVTVDTACSGGLVALHLACQSLRMGEAEQAIAAGVNVILSHEAMTTMSAMQFLSPDGRCYTFDDRANGYARGEGVGCVILKPLDKALADGDAIRAVIRSSGVNQDGRTPGITLPSQEAQEQIIRHVYDICGLDPVDTSYVECHGTGTAAGDPLEAGAVASVFCRGRRRDQPLYIGSVKTNLGHLEAASGLAGFIKVVLMLENKVILPNCNFETPNKAIPFEEWKLKVPTEPEPWEGTAVRRASINSFGYGGTNAHCIVEETEGFLLMSRGISPRSRPVSHPRQCSMSRVFVLLSFDEISGKNYAHRLAGYLTSAKSEADNELLQDLADTLARRRTQHPWKACLVASTRAELIEALTADTLAFSRSSTQKPLLGFVFTGQGAQWHAMGRELILRYPVFSQVIQDATGHLQSLGASWDVKEELFKSADESRLGEGLLCQPITTVLQIALVELLASWSVVPTAVTGHSSGEIAAAYAAGALSLEDAITVAFYRGVMADRIRRESSTRGAMVAICMSEDAILPYLESLREGRAQVACVNSPSLVTVSGDESAIAELEARLAKEDNPVYFHRPKVDVAYHSEHMEPVAEQYLKAISGIKARSSGVKEVQFFSSVYGTPIPDLTMLGPEYWVANLTGKVLFAPALSSLCLDTRTPADVQAPIDVLVEIGPHSALKIPAKQTLSEEPRLQHRNIEYLSALRRNHDGVQTAQQLAATLKVSGYPVDIAAVNMQQESPASAPLVDLPPYAWNHTREFWTESWISKAYRTAPGGLHDLLGLRDPASVTVAPRWRNVLRISDLPWLEDHSVSGNVVFPAAGYLAMAVEAAAQQADALGKEPVEYWLREIVIQQALLFPLDSEDGGGVEVRISLEPYADNLSSASAVWQRFSIVSIHEEDQWTEHCCGLVSVLEAPKPNVVRGELQSQVEKVAHEAFLAGFRQGCTGDIDVAGFYRRLKEEASFVLGPTFANMETVSVGPNRASGVVKMPNTAEVMPSSHETPLVVHPATLDTVVVMAYHAFEAATTTEIQAPFLPVSMREVRVSATLRHSPGEQLRVLSEARPRNSRQFVASTTVVAEEDPSCPLISIVDLAFTILDQDKNGTEQDSQPLAYRVAWAPDLEYLSAEDIRDLCSDKMTTQPPPCESGGAAAAALEQAAFYYFEDAMAQLPPSYTPEMMHPHHRLQWGFMQRWVEKCRQGELPIYPTAGWHTLTPDRRARFLAEFEHSSDEGRLTARVGRHLAQILQQEIDPLQLMMEDGLVEAHYRTHPHLQRTYQAAARYLALLAHKDPGMSVLEVGAGTGGATVSMLEGLRKGAPGGRAGFAEYVFSDISSGFFDAAKIKLSEWVDVLDFQTLDIERDPGSQGFERHSYDLVIAVNVLHATRSMEATMRHVRSLLKPGGTLLVIELARVEMASTLVFGTLPGWWAGAGALDDGREEGPVLSEDRWAALLERTGFSGLDVTVRDYPEEEKHRVSLMISTAVPSVPRSVPSSEPPGMTILTTGDSAEEAVYMEYLQTCLRSYTASVEVGTLDSVHPAGRVCILLDSWTQPLLSQPTAAQWEALKRVANSATGLLWIVHGASVSCDCPTANMASGFVRNLRAESGMVRVALLDVEVAPWRDRDTVGIQTVLDQIAQVAERLFIQSPDQPAELEMAICGGKVYIPRVVVEQAVAETIQALTAPTSHSAHEVVPFDQPDRPLRMEIGVPGLLESIHFVDDDDAELPSNAIEVHVQAMGVNFRDVMMAMGQINPDVACNEFSGTVTAIGSGVQQMAVGDRVAGYALTKGTYTSRVRVEERFAQVIPAEMSFETAASLPVVYCTAYHAVHDVARLTRGETVLIHSAAGGLGQALIELSLRVGAEVFVTVGSEEKKAFLMSRFGIPASHIFFSRDGRFHRDILRMTRGEGVDVVMNSVSGELLRLTWQCIGPLGRFVEVGLRDSEMNSRLEMTPFTRNASFASFHLTVLASKRPQIAARVWATVMDLFRAGELHGLSPITTYGISELETAFRIMQRGQHIGKLVVVPQPEDCVQALRRPDSALFRRDVSYVLVGGMGGLGRALAEWMVASGGVHLVILSRRGATAPGAQEAVKTLEGLGGKVLLQRCDVGSASDVSAAIQAVADSDMPPIRGVIHGAMVLRDSLLEYLPIADYNAVVHPKVQGAWNLHNLLPRDLDFFLMLSSMSGLLGTASQAPYAASSTFQDAFAQYRRSQGLQACALDLCIILEVGYVAEAQAASRYLQTSVLSELTRKEFLARVSAAIRHPDGPAQWLTGLEPWDAERSPSLFRQPFFSHFRQLSTQGRAGSSPTQVHPSKNTPLARLRGQLAQVAEGEAVDLLRDVIVWKLSHLSMIPVEDIDPGRSLASYGVDSLVAVELRNWIAKELEATVSILELVAQEPLAMCAQKVAQRSRLLAA